VAAGAVFAVTGWMVIPFYIPGGYSMAFAACLPEKTSMYIEMAHAAKERLVEQCMIHLRNALIQEAVFLMAAETFFLRLMKVD
jgi:hypothetical protein